MCAEAAEAGLGRGVDEAGGFGGRGAVGEVVAFGVKGSAVAVGREEHVGYGAGTETGGVDKCGGSEGGFFVCGVVAARDSVAPYVRGGSDGRDGCYG